RLIALIAAGVCGLALLHGLVSLIVGIVDVVTRRTIEGTVTSARHRYPGDWLPTPIRWILRFRRRRNRDFHQAQRYDRRIRYEIVIDTGTGLKAWNTEARRFDSRLQGQRVRLIVTPLVGYVRSIESLDPAPSAPSPRAATTAAAASTTGTATPAGTAGTAKADTSDPNADVLSQIPG